MQINIILASVTNRLEFVAKFGKSSARGKRHIRLIANTKAVVTALVSLDRGVIILIQVFFAGMHRVHIFHNELAAAHNTAFGAQLVAQLILELINANRQILVALQIITQQINDRLFVRPAETNLSTVLQFRLKPNINQLVTPAPSLLPCFFTLQCAHD